MKTTVDKGITTYDSTNGVEPLQCIGVGRSMWRGRNTSLYATADPGVVISIGCTFDGKMVVKAAEQRSAWTAMIDAFPNEYVSQ